MQMIYAFDPTFEGKPYEDWERIPRVKKCIIRDYIIMGRDENRVQFWNFYDTDMMVRTTLKDYGGILDNLNFSLLD